MLEKLLLGNKYVLDVNVVAIYLVENHPGNRYVSKVIDEGIKRGVEFILFDFIPFRVFWIMTSKWKVDKEEAKDAILSFLNLPNVELSCLDKRDINEAFNLAKRLGHDIYDTVYAFLALKTKAVGIITTDIDFEKICKKLNLHYLNPVPKEILSKFYTYK